MAGEADARTASSTWFTDASRVHPSAGRPGRYAVGEVGSPARPAREQTLHQLFLSDEEACHLELSAVTFVDAGSVRVPALAAAQGLLEERRIVREEPPAAPRRVRDTFRPDPPTVEVAA
ncbi:hypothetical protein [Streptomyces sp. ALI-76-A]|jgi:hypothetical protein|uniref:hypothetical protein n=1 Tax=Streptomyces sp. ALI-76-A TaxID=3025736 RepID=UPI00256EF3D0|nr:hypothetical protein [Streptomyces sp. ALI-76-A]MDL5199202.1 hypothetical protein [Streptomyces sp. ALI-76-A]